MARTTRVLTEGIYFGEGPRWRNGRLWFSDFYAQAVKSVSPEGALATEFEIEDRPSGLGWTPDGSMLIVSMIRRQILRRTPAGQVSVHADLGNIADFHCNDMVVDANGGAYVGNFGFDLDTEMTRRSVQAVIEDHHKAKLAYVAPDGAVQVAASDMSFPNGSVITTDGATLIVAETLGGSLTAFDIGLAGSLSNRRVWAQTWPRVPDGIALDAAGAVWIANPIAPECVRIAEGGEVLEVVATGDPCYACMLGGDDGATLFMLTAPTSLADEARAAPKGRILVTEVDSPHAGRP